MLNSSRLIGGIERRIEEDRRNVEAAVVADASIVLPSALAGVPIEVIPDRDQRLARIGGQTDAGSSADSVIQSLAADMVDGALDGRGAGGVDAASAGIGTQAGRSASSTRSSRK